MKIDWSFPKRVFLSLIVLGGIGSYPLMKYASPETMTPIIAGAIIATINVLLGYAAIEYSFGKSTTIFFKYVLGGMGIRFAVMAGVLVLLIKVYEYPAGALVGSLGVFYTLFLVLEVIFIQKKINFRQQS